MGWQNIRAHRERDQTSVFPNEKWKKSKHYIIETSNYVDRFYFQ